MNEFVTEYFLHLIKYCVIIIICSYDSLYSKSQYFRLFKAGLSAYSVYYQTCVNKYTLLKTIKYQVIIFRTMKVEQAPRQASILIDFLS